MVPGGNFYLFNIIEKKQNYHVATITIPNSYINAVYKQAVLAQKAQAETYGFSHGQTPLHYIEATYKPNILEHLKDLFFTHCVMNFLCQSLYTNKVVIAGDPKLTDVILKPDQDAQFLFDLWRINDKWDEKWKKANLRAPGRKNYKDIDRQVETFIKEELENLDNYKENSIAKGDWICFDMQLLNEDNTPLLNGYKDQLWVKISNEETDKELHELFLGKKVGNTFATKNAFLQDYISNEFNIKYNLLINIKNYVPNAYLSLDLLKKHFQLKNTKEMHLKLIEIFSYRNDISQRREIVEATLKLLLKQYYIHLPQHLLERQKQLVLAAVHSNPDYHVYKAQNDFKEKIKLLAEKQLKETIAIDAIAYQENIKISDKDLLCYLNLMNRQRTREQLIYFKIPTTKFNGQEVPLSTEILKLYCLREKTLNYVINYLTKRNK